MSSAVIATRACRLQNGPNGELRAEKAAKYWSRRLPSTELPKRFYREEIHGSRGGLSWGVGYADVGREGFYYISLLIALGSRVELYHPTNCGTEVYPGQYLSGVFNSSPIKNCVCYRKCTTTSWVSRTIWECPSPSQTSRRCVYRLVK